MSSKKSLSTKPKQTYVGEEVVWAKVAGHGWWPAVVYSGERAQELGIHVPRTKYAVKFLGTDECATLTADNLIDYEQGRAKNEVASAKREKTGFHQAIIEAHELVYGFDEVSDEIRQRFPFVPLVKKEPSTNAKKSATGVTPKRAKQGELCYRPSDHLCIICNQWQQHLKPTLLLRFLWCQRLQH
jgi:hypothetical protein